MSKAKGMAQPSALGGRTTVEFSTDTEWTKSSKTVLWLNNKGPKSPSRLVLSILLNELVNVAILLSCLSPQTHAVCAANHIFGAHKEQIP